MTGRLGTEHTTARTVGFPRLSTPNDTGVREAREEWFVITAEGRALLERLAAAAEGAPQDHAETQAALLARLGGLDAPDTDAELDDPYLPGT